MTLAKLCCKSLTKIKKPKIFQAMVGCRADAEKKSIPHGSQIVEGIESNPHIRSFLGTVVVSFTDCTMVNHHHLGQHVVFFCKLTTKQIHNSWG